MHHTCSLFCGAVCDELCYFDLCNVRNKLHEKECSCLFKQKCISCVKIVPINLHQFVFFLVI